MIQANQENNQEQERIKELLKPRIIATGSNDKHYPNSPFKVGEIITIEKEDEKMMEFSLSFPHLFRKLGWWEGLKVSELPEYVRSKLGVFKVEWSVRNNELYLTDATDKNDSWIMIHTRILPATLEEYTTYLNQP